jgi:DNA-binding response OmpR family regulator
MAAKDKKIVLLVDDEVAMVWLLTNYLSDFFEVVTKTDGQEALQWLQAGNSPDVIVLDINMPNLNGYDLLAKVRATSAWKDVPVIMLSAMEKTSEKIKSFQLGANDYVVKPFNPAELKARLSIILGLPHLL